MDAQWTPQGIGVVKEVEISSTRQPQLQAEKRARPYKEQSLNCPRCNSTNTKFCYYNNYSLSQPRYFCKTCRRYWTDGGSLRNVPVGGGSRKNKRSSSYNSSSNNTTTTTSLASLSSPNLQPTDQPIPTVQIPIASSRFYQGSGQDLNLSFQNQSLAHHDQLGASAASGSISAMELLRSGISAKGFAPFSAAQGSVFGSGFGFQELLRQSNLKLPLDHHSRFSGSMHQMQEGGGGRLLFPFEDLKQVHVNNGGHEEEANGVVQEQGDPGLFWNGGNGRGGGAW